MEQNQTSNPPLLSIGLPVYNGAKWLADAVESMLEQDFTDFELLIVDNASTDNTAELAQHYAALDHRVKHHRNPQNIGLYRNFDRAFELASGKYFKWAADSDFCLPGFFKKCVDVLEQRSDVVLAYPQAFLLVRDQMGEEIAYEYFDDFNLEDERPSERFIKYLNREKINNVMHGVIRVSALQQTSLIRPLPGSDISMVAELSLLGKFVEVHERLFVRRFDDETSSMLMNKKTAAKKDVPLGNNIRQRVDLHGYRFYSCLKAPIPFGEKLRVCFYLFRRITWLRHKVMQRLVRGAIPGR